MTPETLLAADAPPDDADLALQAMFWAGKGDWQAAHACVQQNEGDPDCDWVHAHLHRREGDLENAAHWYRSARRPLAGGPLEAEWARLATELLSRR